MKICFVDCRLGVRRVERKAKRKQVGANKCLLTEISAIRFRFQAISYICLLLPLIICIELSSFLWKQNLGNSALSFACGRASQRKKYKHNKQNKKKINTYIIYTKKT